MLQGHGDNGYIYGQEILADFSTNVWHGKEPAGLKKHLFNHWDRINRYPEVIAESLAARIAEHHGLDAANVLVTAGTTESIYLLAQLFRANARTVIVIPAFSEYEDACSMHGHKLQFMNWDELDRQPLLSGTPMIWIANPGNPTGAIFPGIGDWIRTQPGTTFILDEAFIEFTTACSSLIPLLHELPNLVIMRSLTKAFAIPGLRLGYIAADRHLINKLQVLKMPWSVNALAMEAGHYIFNHYTENMPPLSALLHETTILSQQLQALGYYVYPGHTHFLLCKTPEGTASDLQKYLLDEHGILIRNADNFRGLGPQHFRVATLTPGRNRLLIDALRKFRQRC